MGKKELKQIHGFLYVFVDLVKGILQTKTLQPPCLVSFLFDPMECLSIS